MTTDVLVDIAQKIAPNGNSPLALRQGIVTAVDATTGTLSVRIAGYASAVPAIRSLISPVGFVVGDTVWLLENNSDYLVIGKLVGAGGQAEVYPTFGALELRHPTANPYIDFTRTPGTADYNVRLINETSEQLRLYSIAGPTWGAFRVGNAMMAAYGWNSDIAAFGHATAMNVDSTSYAFLHEPDGSVDINSKGTAHEIRLRIDGSDKVIIGTSGQRNYDWIRCQNSGIGIYFATGGGGWFMQDSTWIRAYGDKGIYTGSQIRAQSAEMKGWPTSAADHAQFSHINRGGGEGYGFLQRWDGYVFISSTGTVDIAGSTGVAAGTFDGTAVRFAVKGTDRWGSGHAHRFYDDGECWHYSVGIGGDNGDNAGLRLSVGKGEFYRFDQLGNWDVNPIWTSSGGGGSGARITFRAAGQNAAPMIKSWGGNIEFREWNDAGFIITRSIVENYSRAAGKADIRDASTRLPKAQRKQKVRSLRTVHYKRSDAAKGCANCMGTGKATENRRIREAVNQKALRKKREHSFDGLPAHILEVEEPQEGEPCPDCGGQGMSWRRPEELANEQDGWFGFVVEEVVAQFPEATFYRQDEDGVVRPSGLDHMALIALLWEEVKDLEERLVAVETKGK